MSTILHSSTPRSSRGSKLHPRLSGDDLALRGLLGLIIVFLFVGLILPLYALLSKSMQSSDGEFIGLQNFCRFFAEPGLTLAVWNSFFVAIIATAITVTLALGFAFALTRSRIPAKSLFRAVAMTPLLAPSLLPAIALIYLFGNQGIIKGVLFGNSIYGPIGIIIGEVLFSFPHAVLIISTALANSDQRLYDAAVSLRAGPMRTFFAVTLPSCRYGLLSAALAVFTLVFTDFGVPAVVGGSYPVLATEIYKQVIGRFDFEMGAVVGLFLLMPAVISFTVDRLVHRSQTAMVTARSVPLAIKPNRLRDTLSLAMAGSISVCMVAVLSMAAFGSLIRFWPYNLTLTLKNYDFRSVDSTGWDVYANSLTLSGLTATIGTVVIFLGAYLIEKMRGAAALRSLAQLLCMLPLAVPGMVLGLAYIFFFNDPANPLNGIYGTMAILVLCTIVHFYTVPHLTALTALKQIDSEFEAVGMSLRVPSFILLWRVTIPLCLPALLGIWSYLFINAMTTVSAVVFLYSAEIKLASITIVKWNDGGKLAQAAALSMVIFATSAIVVLLQNVLARGLLARTGAWQQPHV